MVETSGNIPVVDVDNDRDSEHEPVIDVDEENVEDGNNDGNRRSFVWKHFTYKKGALKVKCPYCSKVLSADTSNGTTSLGKHLKLRCKNSPLYKKADMRNQSTLKFKPTSLDEMGVNTVSRGFSFSQDNGRKVLAEMCIIDNRPFCIVENQGFRKVLLEFSNYMFKIPSRWTVARDCISIYEEETNKLKSLLKNQIVSLTTDTWTSVQNYNYMCLTAHWIDENWTLNKKILNFCQISDHKGVTIGKLVYKCLTYWGIDRIFTVTVDNAASNDGAIRYLKSMLKGPNSILDCKYIHLRCCAHIINLVVRDGLEEQNVSISKIRKAVKFLRSSPSRYTSFLDCVGKTNILCKSKPCLDVETRWNSTFLMLETAEKYKDAFDRLQEVDINYRTYFQAHTDEEENTRKRKSNDRVLGAPEDEDWENARNFIEYLRIFFDVTNKVSGSKYVTSNLFFIELTKMSANISKLCLDDDERRRNMAFSMKLKYDKYWDNIDNANLLLHIALVLDPRRKMFYLEFCLNMIYGENSVKGNAVLKLVENALDELFEHYKMKMEKTHPKSFFSSSSTSSGFNSPRKVDMDGHFKMFKEKKGLGVNKNEVQVYKSDEPEEIDGDFDILSWWKSHSIRFPVLSQVARHVLGMPVSTVASESAFSTGGRVIDKFRSSLTPKVAEALICTQDWLRSTPVDIEFEDMSIKDVEETTERYEMMEIEAFYPKIDALGSNED